MKLIRMALQLAEAAAALDGSGDLVGDAGEQAYLMARVVVWAARAHIDDAEYIAARHQRYGEHGFVLAFEHLREVFEPMILIRLPAHRNWLALACYPTGN